MLICFYPFHFAPHILANFSNLTQRRSCAIPPSISSNTRDNEKYIIMNVKASETKRALLCDLLHARCKEMYNNCPLRLNLTENKYTHFEQRLITAAQNRS